MDLRYYAEVQTTCGSIRFASDKKDTEVCLKDLILYLRRDDDAHTTRRLLGQLHVVGNLLPLFKGYAGDAKIWEVILRLLLNLSYPVLLLYNEEVPTDKTRLSHYRELEAHLRSYKKAFVDHVVWSTLAGKLEQLLELEWDKRTEQDKLTIERILVLIRNVLLVPADFIEEKIMNVDTSLHGHILRVMHCSGMMDLLLFTVTAASTQDYSLLCLEIMSLMLREQTGEQLASTQLARNEEEKLLKKKQNLAARHSSFGGTFVVRDIKAPSGNDMLCHKPISSISDLNLDKKKQGEKVRSRRKPIVEKHTTRRSTIPVRMILKEFCASILAENRYNKMMVLVKDNINRGWVEDNDETYFLWALKFFMEFNRHSDQFLFHPVLETMNIHTFHYVQTLLDKYQGMMVTDKQKLPFWSRRTHIALKAYQELLFTLVWMNNDEGENVRDASWGIQSNLFYLPECRELRELCLGLLHKYNPVKFSKLYLKDLIETNHLFLKMLEHYLSANRRVMIKSKGNGRKSTETVSNGPPSPSGSVKVVKLNSSQLAWVASVSEQISSAFLSVLSSKRSEVPGEAGEEKESASINTNVIPFDAASDEQKETASREVRPTDPVYFGKQDFNVEFLRTMGMEKAIMVNVPKVEEARTGHLQPQQKAGSNNSDEVDDADSRRHTGSEDDRETVVIEDENEEGEEEQDDEEIGVAEAEQEFDFRAFLLKYATAQVVANYALLFQDWQTLKPLTLHAILKMFHRFAFDMDYPALICQASIFFTFKKIYLALDYLSDSDFEEVKEFFVNFWPKFVKLCEDKRMFVEILFWKTAREAQDIQDGYVDVQEPDPEGGKKKRSAWTKEEETELGLLVKLYRDSPEEVKKAQTLLDYIMEHWTWGPRSKKMFQNKLVRNELVDPTEFAKKKRAPKIWGADELEKLRELFEKHRDADDTMSAILSEMEMKRSRKSVMEKMLEMGLIRDKSEIKKKRTGDGNRSRGSRQYKSTSQVEWDAKKFSNDDSGEHKNPSITVDNSRSGVSSSSHVPKRKLSEGSEGEENEDVVGMTVKKTRAVINDSDDKMSNF